MSNITVLAKLFVFSPQIYAQVPSVVKYRSIKSTTTSNRSWTTLLSVYTLLYMLFGDIYSFWAYVSVSINSIYDVVADFRPLLPDAFLIDVQSHLTSQTPWTTTEKYKRSSSSNHPYLITYIGCSRTFQELRELNTYQNKTNEHSKLNTMMDDMKE